jgi:Trk K+ transport system NAD-binding subunit
VMRIIVFGACLVTSKLAEILNGDNIEVIEAVVRDNTDPAESFASENADLIVVEGDEEDVAALCQSLRKCVGDVPVALVVSRNRTDWRKVSSADADGYLYREDGTSQMKARLKAITRSFVPTIS